MTTTDSYVAVHEKMLSLEQQIAALKQQLHTTTMQAVEAAVQRTFINEVSDFHRESLLPLVTIVEKILAKASETAAPAHAEQVKQIRAFVAKVGERANHFNANGLVAQCRARALAEQKRLESVKTTTP